jgi:hypothetical protein
MKTGGILDVKPAKLTNCNLPLPKMGRTGYIARFTFRGLLVRDQQL